MARTGFIYKVVCNISNLTYVGSTFTAKLSVRLAHHRGHYKYFLKGKGNYITSFKIIERGDYNIHLIETVQVDTIYELRLKERYYVETLECVNKVRPALFEDEKDEYFKKYYEDNKEEFKIKFKKYYEEHKEEKRVYYQKYWEVNKEKIAEKRKEYHDRNKDEINRKKREKRAKEKLDKLNCEVGETVRIDA